MVNKKRKYFDWRKNETRLSLTFYGAIILTLIIHYFFVSSWDFDSTMQMAISFLIFNIIFGIGNILLKVNFLGEIK